MSRRVTLAAVAVAAALALAGCASGGSEPKATDGTTSFDGEWQLVKARDADGTMEVNGAPVTLVIAGDAINGQAPCNTYTGSATIDGTDVSFDRIAQTLLACVNDARTELETRYLGALANVTGATLTDQTLTLSGPDETLQFLIIEKKKANQP